MTTQEKLALANQNARGYEHGHEYGLRYNAAIDGSVEGILARITGCIETSHVPEDKAYYVGYERGFKDARRIP